MVSPGVQVSRGTTAETATAVERRRNLERRRFKLSFLLSSFLTRRRIGDDVLRHQRFHAGVLLASTILPSFVAQISPLTIRWIVWIVPYCFCSLLTHSLHFGPVVESWRRRERDDDREVVPGSPREAEDLGQGPRLLGMTVSSTSASYLQPYRGYFVSLTCVSGRFVALFGVWRSRSRDIPCV